MHIFTCNPNGTVAGLTLFCSLEGFHGELHRLYPSVVQMRPSCTFKMIYGMEKAGSERSGGEGMEWDESEKEAKNEVGLSDR